jgi:hypothetical protein
MDEPTRRIPVKLENGVIAHVEATDLGGRHEVDEGIVPRFEGALDTVRAMSSQIYEAMAALKPQRFEVELGFELGVESGQLTALLVKGTGKANLKITLEWKSS